VIFSLIKACLCDRSYRMLHPGMTIKFFTICSRLNSLRERRSTVASEVEKEKLLLVAVGLVVPLQNDQLEDIGEGEVVIMEQVTIGCMQKVQRADRSGIEIDSGCFD